MTDLDLELTGIPESDADKLISAILHGEKIAERAATNIMTMAKKGQEEREVLLERGAVVNLMQMCTADNPASSIAKGALAVASIASNFSECLEETKVYVFEDAQMEAMHHGIVHILTTTLTSWQPDAQAAAANALADLCIQNLDVRKQMMVAEAARALVNLLHSENHDVHCAALAALRAYAVEAKYAEEVVNRGCLSQVCKLALNEGGDRGPARDGARIYARSFALLWMLAVSDDVKKKVFRERDGEVARHVARRLTDKHRAVAYWAAALLRQILILPEHRADLATQGVPASLVSLLKTEDELGALTATNAIGCLHALAAKPEIKEVIVTEIGDSLDAITNPPKGARRHNALKERAIQLKEFLGK